MKVIVTKTYTKEIEIPDGEYCQKEDGSVSCKQYRYDIDPLFGTQFFCNHFGCSFDVPPDGKPICAKRDIKKCKSCLALSHGE